MDHSIRLGRIAGIPIGINWSVAALAGVFVFTLALSILPPYTPDAGTTSRFVAASAGVAVFFGSILAHELGHALVAQAHGIRVEKITLWLLGGLAQLSRSPATPKAEVQVAIAGPAVSAAVGVFFVCVTVIAASTTSNQALLAILSWLAGVNIALAIFNMLPASPLDGGRVLTAMLWRSLEDPHRARVIAGRCGLILGSILIIAGVAQAIWVDPTGVFTALVGLFVFTAARSEIVAAFVAGRISNIRIADVLSPYPTPVHDSTPIASLLEGLTPAQHHIARPVVRWDYTPIGYVVPSRGMSVDRWSRVSTPISTITTPISHIVTANADTTLNRYIHRWVHAGDIIVAVNDPETNATMGTLTPAQIQHLLTKPKFWGLAPDRDRRAWRLTCKIAHRAVPGRRTRK